MKKRIILAATLLTAGTALHAQMTQVMRWANTVGGNSTVTLTRREDAIRGIVEDGYSNTYVIGNYTGSISFQEYDSLTSTGLHTGSPVTKNYTSVSGSQDVFLARYDINGYCTWSATIGGAGLDEGNAITMSNPGSPSDFYITGMFNNSMTIGATTLNKINSGYAVNDAFIIRYNTSLTTNPTLNWAHAFGGYTETCGMGIALSGSNVYITGYYTELCMDSVDIILEKKHISGSGSPFSTPTPGYLEFPYHDLFVARFSNAGAYSAALRTYASDDEVEGHGIAISGTDLYVTGTFKGSAKFTSPTVTANGHSDAFVARYPLTFTSTTLATSVAIIGGPSTVYQGAPEEPFYKQDEGYAICATNFGIFATGRFMDQSTFGTAGTINPSGSATETYMYLVRYDAAMSATPVVETGTANYSEGRGIFGLNGNILTGAPSTIFVVGGAVSTASINGTQVETNGYTAENVGFIQRIAYTTAGGFGANVNNFVDGIAQNMNGLNGTGLNDINVVGFGVSYRVGCAYRIGGRFSSKTAFGNREKTSSGAFDAFLSERENAVSVTANTYNCGSGSVVLTGTGGTSPEWSIPPAAPFSYTTSVTVSPTVTTTYQFASTSGSCAPSVSPVIIYNFPPASAVDAGPNKDICGTTHTVIIGPAAQPGYTYSWTPTSNIVGGAVGATQAQPTASVTAAYTTFTVTVIDKCGNTSSDVVTVHYDTYCPHRLAAPGDAGTANPVANVYPNPNNGTFTIETNSTNAKDIFIYDAMGKLVFSSVQTTDASIAVDISAQPKGLYVIRIVNGGEIQEERIINQ